MSERADKEAMACNKPRRTPGHAKKSHVVKACYDGKQKLIRFGEQGASTAGKPKAGESERMKTKRASFKSRHAKNIAKGKSSAAYWADRVKWNEGGMVKMAAGGSAALALIEQMRRSAGQSQEFDPTLVAMREQRARPARRPTPQAASRMPEPQAAQPREAPLPLPPVPPAMRPDENPPPEAPRNPMRFDEGNPHVATAIRMAEKYNLPRDIFLSLVQQESRFNPAARSPRGAIGLGQLMPATARELGVDPLDPEQNLEGSARYLRQMLDRFKDMPLALAAYNAGPGRVARAGNTIPNIRETQQYVPSILRRAGANVPEGYAEGGEVSAYDPETVEALVRSVEDAEGRRVAASLDYETQRFLDLLREANLEVSGGGIFTPIRGGRVVGGGANARVAVPIGREGAVLDLSGAQRGVSASGRGFRSNQSRLTGAGIGYTTPSGGRLSLDYHDRLMGEPDTLPGADPIDLMGRPVPSRGLRLGYRREFAEGGLAQLEQKYAEGGRVGRAVGAIRRAVTRRAPEPEKTYPRAEAAPTFKVEPEPGQPFESWLDSLYSPEVRGPDNITRHPSLMYRGVSDAELEAAIQNQVFRPLSDPALFIENDPSRYTGGGAYGARNAGAIVQFDVGGLPSVRQSSQRVRDLVEDAVPEIPTERVTRIWRWDPERRGHYLMSSDEMNEFMRRNTASLEDLDRKYAEGGAVSDEDAEYDRRLLSRMKAQTGRVTEPTRAEQMQALRTAGRSAAEGVADVLLPQSPLDLALMVALSPVGGRAARLAGSAALASLEPSEAEAIISPATARAIRMATRIPQDMRFKKAVEATPGARITDDGLELELIRYQKPEQAGAKAIREGVFYLPATLPSRSVGTYRGTSASTYGGPDLVRGETLLRAPLAMPGNTGGVVPERAFRELTSDADMRRLERDSRAAANSGLLGPEYRENIENFLDQWGGNPNVAHELVSNSRGGNRMRYALQENVIGNRARQEGYDSIVGTGARTPRITEVFDLREAAYPVPGAPEFEMLLPQYEMMMRGYAQGGLAALDEKYAEGGEVSAMPYNPDAVDALVKEIEAEYV